MINSESALYNLVRVGTVSSVDLTSLTARVIYMDKQDVEGTPLTSGPLKILNQDSLWLPYEGQLVVCLYMPISDSDGFIIGAIRSGVNQQWQQ